MPRAKPLPTRRERGRSQKRARMSRSMSPTSTVNLEVRRPGDIYGRPVASSGSQLYISRYASAELQFRPPGHPETGEGGTFFARRGAVGGAFVDPVLWWRCRGTWCRARVRSRLSRSGGALSSCSAGFFMRLELCGYRRGLRRGTCCRASRGSRRYSVHDRRDAERGAARGIRDLSWSIGIGPHPQERQVFASPC